MAFSGMSLIAAVGPEGTGAVAATGERKKTVAARADDSGAGASSAGVSVSSSDC